jgi:hypothetical protein|nr:MAG TPA_asm: hypothetical protein [Caudoviricetes sp.]
MTTRTKTFYEENKTIEIVEHTQTLISMTVTLYDKNGSLTYTKFYDAYGITFEDVVNSYKRLGV